MLVLPRSITENTGMESLAKWRKDSRFKYYLNALNETFLFLILEGAITLRNWVTYLYQPSGKMHFFIRFWPKTSQDSRIVTK